MVVLGRIHQAFTRMSAPTVLSSTTSSAITRRIPRKLVEHESFRRLRLQVVLPPCGHLYCHLVSLHHRRGLQHSLRFLLLPLFRLRVLRPRLSLSHLILLYSWKRRSLQQSRSSNVVRSPRAWLHGSESQCRSQSQWGKERVKERELW